MKNVVIKTMCCLFVIASLFIIAGKIESEYSISGTVIQVHDNTVRIEDTRGKVWETKASGFNYNDKVMIVMYNNHTYDYIYDDEVVRIRKTY